MDEVITFGISIESVIKSKLGDINDILKEDGGGVEFVDYVKDTVKIRLKNNCKGCEGCGTVLPMMIESELINIDDRIKKVEFLE